jgi:hypothetical protein
MRHRKKRNPVVVEVERSGNPRTLSESRRRVLKTKLRELEAERDQLERRINRIRRLIEPGRLVLRKVPN